MVWRNGGNQNGSKLPTFFYSVLIMGLVGDKSQEEDYARLGTVTIGVGTRGAGGAIAPSIFLERGLSPPIFLEGELSPLHLQPSIVTIQTF